MPQTTNISSNFSKYCTGGYELAFNGKEKVNEIYGEGNMYDLGARMYNPQIGKMFSPDPKEAKYPWQSTYSYYANCPISQLDFDGEGDYYNKEGKNLGSDGKTKTITTGKGKHKTIKIVPDDKAYVCESVTLDKGGLVSSAKNSKDLGVSNTELNLYANVVAEESGGDKFESYGIASAIQNLKKEMGTNDLLNTYIKGGVYGYNNNTHGSNYMNNAEYGMEAAINALTGGFDYSNGAIRWDGKDLFTKGFSHVKSVYSGLDISEQHWKTFSTHYSNYGSKNPARAGIHLATAGDYIGMCLYRSVAVHGGTIFWGKNPKNTTYYGTPTLNGFFSGDKPCIETPKSQPNKGFTGSW